MATVKHILTIAQLDKFKHLVQSSNDAFRKGCMAIILEGCDNNDDAVRLEPYEGRRSARHCNNSQFKVFLMFSDPRKRRMEGSIPRQPNHTAFLQQFERHVTVFRRYHDEAAVHGADVRFYASYGDIYITSKNPHNMPRQYSVSDFSQKTCSIEPGNLRHSFYSHEFTSDAEPLVKYLEEHGYSMVKENPLTYKLTLSMGLHTRYGSETLGHVHLDDKMTFASLRKSMIKWSLLDYARLKEDDVDIRFSMQTIQNVPSYSPDEFMQYLTNPATEMITKDSSARGNIRVTPEFSAVVKYVRAKSARFFYKPNINRKYQFAVEVGEVTELQGRTDSGEFKEMERPVEVTVVPWPEDRMPDFMDRAETEQFANDALQFCLQFWSEMEHFRSHLSHEN